jgi:uncharacterized damage-inducible protein DinB
MRRFSPEFPMKMFALPCLLALATLGLRAQTPTAPAPAAAPTLSQSLNRSLSRLEAELVPLAEAMPEEKFGFAPTQGEFKGVKTFVEQIKHVAAANAMFASAILEEKPAMATGGDNGPEAIKTKAEVVKYLKDSFAYMHKALDTVTEANLMGLVKSPWGEGKGSRLGFATLAQGHGYDHYGQVVVYLRMNGIVPPASRR